MVFITILNLIVLVHVYLVRADRVMTAKRISTLGNQSFEERSGKFYWELTIAIPLETFTNHKLSELKGKIFRANFYKCGDKLSEMHYLTWNRVETNNPDFHQPAFFGEIKFC
jgi:hypothetical protein